MVVSGGFLECILASEVLASSLEKLNMVQLCSLVSTSVRFLEAGTMIEMRSPCP